jgi:Mn2+/Fe2+ NRAMP family transporter
MRRILAIIGPGILVAATGVGAGDLATAGFAGGRLGTAILWAVVLGAAVKFVLNEGLARWQLATGETLLEGGLRRFGPVASVAFAVYLLPWSFFVGAALISACGVTMDALLVTFAGAEGGGKLLYGALHAGVGVILVWTGGYRLIERVMAACIVVMFVSVVLTAARLRPDVLEIARGLAVPRIPEMASGGLTWTIGLVGGVGGTLTILCYGYWMRESGRRGPDALRTCRIDLAFAYGMTALFGVAMVVIASRLGTRLDGSGTGLIVALADEVGGSLGDAARGVFLVGAWAAVFSSLLGVWQAVPYVFADFLGVLRPDRGGSGAGGVRTDGPAYRGYLLALAVVPLLHVSHPFREVQKYYAVIGAAFVPILAVSLLVLNGRRRWVGEHVNRPLAVATLVIAVVLSVAAGAFQVLA